MRASLSGPVPSVINKPKWQTSNADDAKQPVMGWMYLITKGMASKSLCSCVWMRKGDRQPCNPTGTTYIAFAWTVLFWYDRSQYTKLWCAVDCTYKLGCQMCSSVCIGGSKKRNMQSNAIDHPCSNGSREGFILLCVQDVGSHGDGFSGIRWLWNVIVCQMGPGLGTYIPSRSNLFVFFLKMKMSGMGAFFIQCAQSREGRVVTIHYLPVHHRIEPVFINLHIWEQCTRRMHMWTGGNGTT